MLEKKMDKSGRESGVVMIEAIYVVVIAVLLIFFTMNVGVIYYNRMTLTAIANEAASGVAEVYGSANKDPFYNFTEYGYFEDRNVYRYFGNGKNELDSMAGKKAKWYASYLVYENEFSVGENLDFSDISVTCKENDLNVQTLTVTIDRTYPVFIMNPVSFWGLNPEYDVQVSGTAVCYDVIHQMNSISLKNELTDRVDSSSTVIKIVKDAIKTTKKIIKFVKKKSS